MQRPKTQDERDLDLYESRLVRPVRMKTPEFERNGRIRHVIFSGQFTAPFLDELAGIADMIRILSKSRAGQDFLINLRHSCNCLPQKMRPNIVPMIFVGHKSKASRSYVIHSTLAAGL